MSNELPQLNSPLNPNNRGPFVIEQIIDPVQVAKDTAINPLDIQNAYLNHAGLFAHYARLKMKAGRQYDRAKQAFELLESKLDHLWRLQLSQEAKEDKTKAKVTEGAITAAVKNDPRWWKAQQAVIDAKSIFDFCKDTLEALSQKRDMLVQFGADQRQERQGQMRVMDIMGGGTASALRDAAQNAREVADRLVADAKES